MNPLATNLDRLEIQLQATLDERFAQSSLTALPSPQLKPASADAPRAAADADLRRLETLDAIWAP